MILSPNIGIVAGPLIIKLAFFTTKSYFHKKPSRVIDIAVFMGTYPKSSNVHQLSLRSPREVNLDLSINLPVHTHVRS